MCTGTHPFIPAPGTARLELVAVQEVQRLENVLHFAKGSEWTASELVDLLIAAESQWAISMAPVTATNVQLERFKATDLETANGSYAELFPSSTLLGTRGHTPLPNHESLRVRFTTGHVGRNFRGGPYHYGLVAEDIDTDRNSLTTTACNDIVAAWTNFTAALKLATGSELAIVSYCLNNVWRTGANVEIVTAIGLSDRILDSQRRRGPGRGS